MKLRTAQLGRTSCGGNGDAEFQREFVLGCAPLVALLFVFSASVPLLAQSDSSRYGISDAKNVMVAMRDGVKLAADIYRPARNGEPVGGKFTVILLRTPYNKGGTAQLANAFVPYGYVVVLQD